MLIFPARMSNIGAIDVDSVWADAIYIIISPYFLDTITIMTYNITK